MPPSLEVTVEAWPGSGQCGIAHALLLPARLSACLVVGNRATMLMLMGCSLQLVGRVGRCAGEGADGRRVPKGPVTM